MAEYTNLTSLEGLQVGDIVNYSSTTAFDSKGYKFKVELYGKKVTANGGKTVFTIDTNTLPEKTLSFNSRGDLIYGNTTDVYYRIAVAGDAGSGGSAIIGYSDRGGAGGGNTGAKGGTHTLSGKGGSQTSGYFGGAGSGSSNGSYFVGGKGGYGWYGGDGGRVSADGAGGGGGGSGFIIGVSTSTYPAGYLGNDAELQRTIASSISEGLLTQGGSSSYTAKMVLTIIDLPEGGSTQSVIKYYDGNSFVDTTIKYYNGTEFVDCDAFYYNGTEFIKI